MALEGARYNEDPKAWRREYARDYRRGKRRPVVRIPIEERLLAKVDRLYGDVPAHRPELGPCWPWTGGRNSDGYGVLRGDVDPETGKQPMVLAHRVALSVALGRPLLPGMHGNHHCDTPHCCRPRHLYEGTQQQNVADMIERDRYDNGFVRRPPITRKGFG